MRAVRRLSATTTGLAAAAALLVTPTPAQAATGVCDGVARCRVVARVDVDGDGTRDTVGIARRGANGAAEGRVVVRVQVGAAEIVTVRRRTEFWHGSLWQGAAFLDGRPGRDLVVGFTQGAHAQHFHALTWRGGRLVTLDAPGRDEHWMVDSAANFHLGWWHRDGDPRGTLQRRQAVRSETGRTFRAAVTTFRWADGGWERVAHRTRNRSEDQVVRWGGFHVPGLQRF